MISGVVVERETVVGGGGRSRVFSLRSVSARVLPMDVGRDFCGERSEFTVSIDIVLAFAHGSLKDNLVRRGFILGPRALRDETGAEVVDRDESDAEEEMLALFDCFEECSLDCRSSL